MMLRSLGRGLDEPSIAGSGAATSSAVFSAYTTAVRMLSVVAAIGVIAAQLVGADIVPVAIVLAGLCLAECCNRWALSGLSAERGTSAWSVPRPVGPGATDMFEE